MLSEYAFIRSKTKKYVSPVNQLSLLLQVSRLSPVLPFSVGSRYILRVEDPPHTYNTF